TIVVPGGANEATIANFCPYRDGCSSIGYSCGRTRAGLTLMPLKEVVMKAQSKLIVIALAGALSSLVAGTPVRAAEITVVAGGGPLPDVLGTLMPMFEKATGNKVKLSSKGLPEITSDLKSGADLVITNTEIVDDL